MKRFRSPFGCLLIAVLWARAAWCADEPDQRWALLIGINDYAELEDLRYAGADVRALKQELLARGFNRDNLFVVEDRAEQAKYRPSKGNIERQLKLVMSLAEKNDLVLISFSGHGVHVDGKSYLCPADALLDDTDTLIALDEVYDWLKHSPAAIKLMVVDACRDDPRLAGRRGARGGDVTSRFAVDLERPPQGVVILNSCAPGQASMEEKQFGHGVFMHFLIEGLHGNADGDRDGRVSIGELSQFAGLQTKRYVARWFNGVQTPKLQGDLATDVLAFDLGKLGSRSAERLTSRSDDAYPRLARHKDPAFLGVSLEHAFTDAAAIKLGLDRKRGAYVTGVSEGGPAAAAHIQRGDVIMRFNRMAVRDDEHLTYLVKLAEVGQEVPVDIFRSRRVTVINVRLGGGGTASTSSPDGLERPSSNSFTNSIGMKFTQIPAGEFMMGSDESVADIEQAFGKQNWLKPEWFASEHPKHRVRITQPFYLGVYEVTKRQFARFVEAEDYRTDAERDGKGGSGWSQTDRKIAQKAEYTWRSWGVSQGDSSPVVNVSWNDAVAFCQWVSRQEGQIYRLPTEAEWEYACRAGTTTRFYNGDDPGRLVQIGNISDGTARETFVVPISIGAKDGFAFTCAVGRFRPNLFGLYDMTGNAVEWCSDRYGADYYGNSPSDDPRGPAAGSSRVLRGGGWYGAPVLGRSAARVDTVPGDRGNYVGFRVVCEHE